MAPTMRMLIVMVMMMMARMMMVMMMDDTNISTVIEQLENCECHRSVTLIGMFMMMMVMMTRKR